MENLIKDLRYAVRMLTKNPGVTLVAVVTLALGIGANTAIFSGVSAFLMRPLPVPTAGELVRPMEISDDRGTSDEMSYPDFLDYRNQSTSFTGLSAEDMIQAAIDAENQNDVIWGQVVSANYFDVLQVKPIMGRGFLPDEDKAVGGSPVVVLGHSFWQRRMASDPNIVGKTVQLNNRAYQVIGVVKTGKYRALAEDPKPFFYYAMGQRRPSTMALVVRSKIDPRSLVGAIRGEVQSLDRRVPMSGVKTMDDHKTYALWAPNMAASFSLAFGVLAILLSAVGLYSVMAYIVSQRTREVGIRMALGANRADVIKLITRQGMRLAVVGVGIGLLLALALAKVLSSLLIGVSGYDVTTFILVPTLLAAVALFACYLPARRATKVDPLIALRYE